MLVFLASFQGRVILSAAKNLLFPIIHKQMLRFAQHDISLGCGSAALRYLSFRALGCRKTT